MPCKHVPVLHIAAQRLIADGVIETFDAVYRWPCPNCGEPRRTTRLADTIYALRHAYGWLIDTEQTSNDMLARYKLVRVGDIPGQTSTPHPRRLVRDHPLASMQSTEPPIEWYECDTCGARRREGDPELIRLTSGRRIARCAGCHWVPRTFEKVV